MNKEALFSDENNYFCNIEELASKKQATIRLRAHKEDELSVFLCTKAKRIPLTKEYDEGTFSYYSASLDLDLELMEYYFEIQEKGAVCFYDKLGVTDTKREDFFFGVRGDFDVPPWIKGAVMYQIYVDRFNNRDKSTNVLDNEYYYINGPVHFVSDWNEPPKGFDVLNFYGGDLGGVEDKLSYLKNLGIEAIYLNPIFVSPSNHKYDSQDYDHVDPHYTVIKNDGGACLKEGQRDNSLAERYIKRTTDIENLKASDEFFANFIKKAHDLGIKIIIDGVFNHCGSFHKWMDREGVYRDNPNYPPGAYSSKESPYTEFFDFNRDSKWPNNKDYKGWWDHDTLPKLNYEESEKLKDYILQIAKKWISPPFNADGWRLDVAADLGKSEEYNHSFWKDFRKAVKSANKDAVIIAEHYGSAKAWLKGDEWDTIMNYDAFMDPVSYFLTGMEKHSDRYEKEKMGDGILFRDTMKRNMAQFMAPSLLSSMNQLSNHDHSRFLTRTNHLVGRVKDLGSDKASENVDSAIFRIATVIQLTWPGAPTVYYGDEVGQVGFTDPDSRRTYPWGKEDHRYLDFYRDIIYIRKHSSALRLGSLMFLECGKGYISYARFTETETVTVSVNINKEDITLKLPVWRAAVPEGAKLERIMVTNDSGYSILPKAKEVHGGYMDITLKPKSAAIHRWRESHEAAR